MIFKLIHVILLASIKYFVTLPYAMIIGLEYKYAIAALLFGGIGGFLFFYYLSKHLVLFFNFVKPRLCILVPRIVKQRLQLLCDQVSVQKSAKIFTRKNRWIAKLRSTYGFWGIIIATPFVLSIPVGAFLASKYYSKRRYTVAFMILSIVGWAAVLTGFVHIFPRVFF